MVTKGDDAIGWGASIFAVRHGTRHFYRDNDEDAARKTANLLLAGVVYSEGTATVTLTRRRGQQDEIMESYRVEGGKLLEGGRNWEIT